MARLLVRAPTIVADRFLDRPLRERSQDRTPEAAAQWVAALGSFRGPALVVESGRDEVIPHAVVGAYLATAPRVEHALLPEATHALVRREWQAAFESMVLDFFAPL